MLRKTPMLVALAFVILGELSWGQDRESAVTGTVIYRQRIALTSNAIVDVQLQDVFFQDAPAKLIAEAKIPAAGKQVPIAFRIPYTPGDIDPSHSYAVRATILVNGSRRFTSTASYPVLTRGAPKEVASMVQPGTAAPAHNSTHKAKAKLEGRDWKLIELGGNPIPPGGGNLVLNGDGKRLSGSSGCNRLLGGYKLRPHSLRFTPTGLTRMACPESVMKQEQTFVEALKATTSHRIVGETLELRAGERALARFESLTAGRPSASSATTPTAVNNPTDKWLGQWNGPEGTYLLLSKKGDHYVVKVQSLDGPETYEGIAAGDRIQFTRNGKAESIHAGGGEETGMKWLLDEKNCLIIKAGEGFCRR